MHPLTQLLGEELAAQLADKFFSLSDNPVELRRMAKLFVNDPYTGKHVIQVLTNQAIPIGITREEWIARQKFLIGEVMGITDLGPEISAQIEEVYDNAERRPDTEDYVNVTGSGVPEEESQKNTIEAIFGPPNPHGNTVSFKLLRGSLD